MIESPRRVPPYFLFINGTLLPPFSPRHFFFLPHVQRLGEELLFLSALSTFGPSRPADVGLFPFLVQCSVFLFLQSPPFPLGFSSAPVFFRTPLSHPFLFLSFFFPASPFFFFSTTFLWESPQERPLSPQARCPLSFPFVFSWRILALVN